MRIFSSRSQASQKPRGQSLLQYILIGGIVLLGSLGGLVLLGNTLHTSLQGFQQSLKIGALPNQAAQTEKALSNSAYYSEFTFRTRAGNTFQLQGYPQDMGEAIVTIGANGTTEIILANLDRLIRQLLQNGEINTEQADLLAALSNQGHEIAKIESLLEAAQADSDSRNEFLNTVVIYNGQRYSPPKLAEQIGVSYVGRDLKSGTQIQRFHELKALAAAQGALDEPVVNQVISLMSEQIIAIANGVETGVSRINDYTNVTLAESKASDPLVIKNMNLETPVSGSLEDFASMVTHNRSAVICNTGRGRDSGADCRP
jgi:hypothetical protein